MYFFYIFSSFHPKQLNMQYGNGIIFMYPAYIHEDLIVWETKEHSGAPLKQI